MNYLKTLIWIQCIAMHNESEEKTPSLSPRRGADKARIRDLKKEPKKDVPTITVTGGVILMRTVYTNLSYRSRIAGII